MSTDPASGSPSRPRDEVRIGETAATLIHSARRAAAALPLAARAHSQRFRLFGFLGGLAFEASPGPFSPLVSKKGLGDAGYVEGPTM